MSDSEDKARSLRIKRSIAREIATGVDNPVVADLRKLRREISRECGHDLKKYARYMREQAEAFEREWGLNLKRWDGPSGPVNGMDHAEFRRALKRELAAKPSAD